MNRLTHVFWGLLFNFAWTKMNSSKSSQIKTGMNAKNGQKKTVKKIQKKPSKALKNSEKGAKKMEEKSTKTLNAKNYEKGVKKLSPSYFEAANILKQMYFKRGSINSLISKCKHQNLIKMTYALAIKYLQNQKAINAILKKFVQKKSEADMYLMKVLLADLLYGTKKFRTYRKTKEINLIMNHLDEITKYHETLIGLKETANSAQPALRFLRVNLVKTTIEQVVQAIQAADFREVTYLKDKTSFESFKALAIELEEDQFLRDYHFSDILCLNTKATKKLQDLDIYKEYHIAMQDKASLIPIECMHLKPGMTIMETCAAPGMKTAAIASRTNNQCTLYANDYDKDRYLQMQKMLARFGVQAQTINLDFLDINVEDYQDLDVILVDPSCSGTGMFRRLDYDDEDDQLNDNSKQKRIEKLAKLQLEILRKAALCRPKRLIYCTCSTDITENEHVVFNLLSGEQGEHYELINPLPEWPVRGKSDYDFNGMVFRSSPDETLTQGFFCCVFQRKESAVVAPKGEILDQDDQNQEQDHSAPKPSKKKRKKSKKL